MSFTLGIVGLPNVGKSTLFNALTNSEVEASNYPFCTIDPNVGVVEVPDPRVGRLTDIYNSEKVVPTVVEFVDIAGLVKGASKGEGLGNTFLSHIREVQTIIHIVRCFEDDNITHVEGSIDPVRDIEVINSELCLADLEAVGRRIDRVSKLSKTGDKKIKSELEFLHTMRAKLDSGSLIGKAGFSNAEHEILRECHLLTYKQCMYVANIAEDDIGRMEEHQYYKALKDYCRTINEPCDWISCKIEHEISQLNNNEKNEFLQSVGLKEPGLYKIIRTSYRLLGLITFFTCGPKETHAWTISDGATAPKAAGKIHSDMERGFIRAEVIGYDAINNEGNEKTVKEKGLLRTEGKEYEIKDGDILNILFNV